MVLTQIIEVINSVADFLFFNRTKSQMQAKKEKAKDVVEIAKEKTPKKEKKKVKYLINTFFFASRKLYALKGACTVWEEIFPNYLLTLEQHGRSTSTKIPLGTTIHNIELKSGKGG